MGNKLVLEASWWDWFFFLSLFFFREEKKKCFSGTGNCGPVNIHRCTQDAFTTSSLRWPLKHVNKGTHGVVLCSVSSVWDARSDVRAHLIHAILPVGSLELFVICRFLRFLSRHSSPNACNLWVTQADGVITACTDQSCLLLCKWIVCFCFSYCISADSGDGTTITQINGSYSLTCVILHHFCQWPHHDCLQNVSDFYFEATATNWETCVKWSIYENASFP